MSKPNLEPPKPPPFPAGTRLRYCGTSNVWMARTQNPRAHDQHPEDWVQVVGPGFETVIDHVKLGRQGTGMLIDQDDEIYDETRDGYSVYYVPSPIRRHGRCIFKPDDWEVIK